MNKSNIIDVEEKNFEKNVLEESSEKLVVVDFWAPWCGPCKQLGPLLEKIVTEANGAVKMVKIDIDQNQNLAQQLRIQSIPAVYAFHHGKPVDAFQGALPESQLREFVEKLAKNSTAQEKSPIEEAIEHINLFSESTRLSHPLYNYTAVDVFTVDQNGRNLNRYENIHNNRPKYTLFKVYSIHFIPIL